MTHSPTTSATRVAYGEHDSLRHTDCLVIKKRGGGEREITAGKWDINRNTPTGEDPEIWEKKPYNGRRYFQINDLIAVIRESKAAGAAA